MRILKHIISGTVWSLLALYLMLLLMTHIPACQAYIGAQAARILGNTLGTSVSIGRVDLGLLNRIILDDVCILDHNSKEMLRISRLTARVKPIPLTEGKIHISSAQLLGAHALLYQANTQAKPNFQFIIDSLAPKDTTRHTPLDLRVNSFIMRHSSVRYDRLDAPLTPGILNPAHLNVSDISAHVILKSLTDDELDLIIKRIGLQEQSGLRLNRLALKLKADRQQAVIQNLDLEMPSTHLHADTLMATYRYKNQQLNISTLAYRGDLSESSITLSDLRCFYAPLKNSQRPINLSIAFNGTSQHIDLSHLSLGTEAGDIRLEANGQADALREHTPEWRLNIQQLALSDNIIDFLQKNIPQIPEQVKNLGYLLMNGQLSGGRNGSLTARALIKTGIGQLNTDFLIDGSRQFKGQLNTQEANLRQLTGNDELGQLTANVMFSGRLVQKKLQHLKLEGTIEQVDYHNYPFRSITLNGVYNGKGVAGLFQIDDPNLSASLEGQLEQVGSGRQMKFVANGAVGHISPKALNLTDRWDDAVFAGDINADFTASSLNDAVGELRISRLSKSDKGVKTYQLDNLLVMSDFKETEHHIRMVSDFAKVELLGRFEYTTLPQSITNLIASKLPTLPGLPPIAETTHNNFTIRMQVYKTDFLQQLLSIDLSASQPITLDATINDHSRTMALEAHLPRVTYNEADYADGQILMRVLTPMDTLRCNVSVSRISNDDRLNLSLRARAADNKLSTALSWNDGKTNSTMSGEVNAITQLYRNLAQKPEAHIRIQPSHIILNDTVWLMEPSDILYAEQNLLVDHFNLHHGKQHITIDGRASKHAHDSLTVDLNEVEVAYILDLVGFHTVEFSGKATGKAIAHSLFTNFGAHADLTVSNFKFENGRMGTLFAHAKWNREKEQIDISATADDGPEAITHISGFVSPVHSTIDLAFGARGTYIDFIHNFTSSFLSHITGHAEGDLRLAGTFDDINLTGAMAVEGEAAITALNTTYQLHRDTVVFIPDEIEIRQLPITDKYGNRASLSGNIHHQHLTNMTFDLAANTDNLLAYDFKDFGEGTFYGTVFASGDVTIKGRPGEVTIDCDVTPQKNTLFVYNASSPTTISRQEFIQWGSGTKQAGGTDTPHDNKPKDAADIPTDIYINLLINCTPDATLRLLMDANTNDYITLNGEGTIRATYYNKGPFNMFGTYTVDRGTYGITIQNIIQKNFTFNPGGTIVFGGDPYNAALNLQAQYTVNGVSLSDLSIGNTFAANTIRVNCLMNIGGQPNAPQVDFDLEMPTVNAEEQQMVRSYINGQQEMNQQVLYLLAIGRFYNQQQNNANSQQQGQTSLAMQSFLSGTLSTQINNLLKAVIKKDNWHFGANISTGDEGWHNAEYEGLISGRMLNNRLLLNGQFGYRDNAKQATPSFIGDFDIQYLLFPNGNLAVKMYNQTNDRYFTKSSLNTQGIGLIMKKDFNGLGDLFSSKKRKKKAKEQKKHDTKPTQPDPTAEPDPAADSTSAADPAPRE